jgi:hypothetical protein
MSRLHKYELDLWKKRNNGDRGRFFKSGRFSLIGRFSENNQVIGQSLRVHSAEIDDLELLPN